MTHGQGQPTVVGRTERQVRLTTDLRPELVPVPPSVLAGLAVGVEARPDCAPASTH